ncbi:hypothetical protein PHLCEN_2v7474 [Hermanssonia centrifuga]|uniref:Uncharacterized protein n=1 Tax=Hermanssonia centrifuga TaxID=98765 RepID=A0A2R6NWL9_9APHY|nr:hypothetical protein PHLCEN_2v7474 [Hermanssonia centrifuga]
MHTEDGRSITAVAKEKEEARREHEQAIQQGRMTGLVEHVTDDVFTISLGSLPSLQMITIRLTYVLDLMDDDLPDQVRFQLPLCVGMRYGTLPPGMQGAKTIPPERISISAEVYMKGAIESITSPSHSTLNVLSDGSVHVGPSVHTRTAEYRSSEFLSQDFILSVKAEGLDTPRCFAQRGPDGSVAMQLTVVPKFNLPTISSQEYIFIVDRSGSMRGDRIETAKRTLVMLLRCLPSQGTSFNIFSFGHRCDSLWQKSMQYDASTLEIATQHVDEMQANYGGTNIQSALNHVFSSRLSSSPTAVFVLTDGEAYDIDGTINAVTQAVANAKKGADLRVFTLGIGETTSTAMCEGIARAGTGVCLMAATSETIIGKCSKLVKASRAEILKDVSIDWGISERLVDSKDKDDAQNTPFRQGPSKLSSLYAGNRFAVFAIFKHERFEMPREVVICAHRTSGEELRFAVAVEERSSTTDRSAPQRPLIHTLAARRIITDLEDGSQYPIPLDTKAAIVHLGEQYQLASQYTSFVAVEERSQQPLLSPGDKHVIVPPQVHREPRVGSSSGGLRAGYGSSVGRGRVGWRARSSFGSERGRGGFGSGRGRGGFGSGRGRGGFGSERGRGRFDAVHSRPRPAIFPGMGSATQHAAHATPPGKKRKTADYLAQSQAAGSSNGTATTTTDGVVLQGTPRSAEDQLVQLVRLQSFDGSFPANIMLAQIVGKKALDEGRRKLGVDAVVWATVLAVAYLQKYMVKQPELLEGLLEKATEFVKQRPGADMAVLLAKAQALVA